MILKFSDHSSLFIKARHKKGLSQLSMAHELGICQKTYSFIEAGKCYPDIIKFLKFAIVTETHPMQILDKLIVGKPPWENLELKEDKLYCEIDRYKAEIAFLKKQNAFQQEAINKLLELQKNKCIQLHSNSL